MPDQITENVPETAQQAKEWGWIQLPKEFLFERLPDCNYSFSPPNRDGRICKPDKNGVIICCYPDQTCFQKPR